MQLKCLSCVDICFQTIGINASKDRDLLKKKLKDLRVAIDRDHKQEERELKVRERLAKLATQGTNAIKKKKFFSK